MLRKIRITLSLLCFVLITLLFLDISGVLSHYVGFLAKIQFLPAILAINIAVVVGLIILTLLFGRVYCSIICPMGVFQDIFSWISGKRKKHKNRFHYQKVNKWLRYSILTIFVLLMIFGLNSIAILIAPYSAYGRMATNLFAPIYQYGNNILADFAESSNSYAFHHVDIWIKSIASLIVAALTFLIIAFLAWKNGRIYCNTICPIGTVLGFLSKFSLFKITIDTQKCNSCTLCERKCKSSCINSKAHQIDYSRCVSCFSCIDCCHKGAISYRLAKKANKEEHSVDTSRREMLAVSGALLASSAIKAQSMKVDGGLAIIEDKQIPERKTFITPAGSLSHRNLDKRCTACQLCISACPNQVLHPSTKLSRLMQPEMSYERGYCRPECTKCSQVCPTKAISKIDKAEKSSIQIGHAVWVKKNCVVITDNVSCGNCARHCPTGAIMMVPYEEMENAEPIVNSTEALNNNSNIKMIPIVNESKCIGCGACENLCPARPFSAIYVEGHEIHKTI